MTHFEHMSLMLDLIHKSASAGPQYAWVGDLASKELARMAPPPAGASKPVMPIAAITTPVPSAPPANDEGAPVDG